MKILSTEIRNLEPIKTIAVSHVGDYSGIEPGEGMQYYAITGGKYFVMQVEVIMAEYGEAWEKAYAAFDEKKHEYDDTRDHYELYVSCVGDTQDPDAPWIVDMCVPMK